MTALENPEYLYHDKRLISIIVRAEYSNEGVNFFTDNTLSQQLGYMKHPKGKVIQPHIHRPVRREVTFTQEVLIIKSGILRVDFYCQDEKYLESRLLRSGDLVLLIEGGHGFEVVEDIEMIEIKQGPYLGDNDKKRFNAPTKFAPRIKPND